MRFCARIPKQLRRNAKKAPHCAKLRRAELCFVARVANVALLRARNDKRCVVCVFAMDAVAAAALAAIVDHDCARVLQDMIAENAALRQELEDIVVHDGAGVLRKLMAANDALCQRLQDMNQHLQDIVDLDCESVFRDLIAENDALRQQRQDFQTNLRQQRQNFQTNLRWQAFQIFELHNAVISLRLARLRNVRTKLYAHASRHHRRKRRVYK